MAATELGGVGVGVYVTGYTKRSAPNNLESEHAGFLCQIPGGQTPIAFLCPERLVSYRATWH